VIVGADSLRTLFFNVRGKTGKLQMIRQPQAECKIHQESDAFFAIAGYSSQSALEAKSTLVESIARKSCMRSKTMAGRLSVFMELSEGPITNDLETFRRQFPELFRKEIAQGDAVQVAFFGMQNGILALGVVSYRVDSAPSEKVHVTHHYQTCPGKFTADKRLMEVLGLNRDIIQLSSSGSFWKEHGSAGANPGSCTVSARIWHLWDASHNQRRLRYTIP
jgi:hypothetical protein